ncbi:GTP cyclohydrolase II [Clostridioides difficile]|nr:GTP cyclohydrolase II [Clostridioides difficile]
MIVDDRDHSRVQGYLILAAECATAQNVAFMVRHSSGLLCVALPASDCDRLELPRMEGVDETDLVELWARVTVDAIDGVTTGISASDRARTSTLLADVESGPRDFTRPGHVVPVRIAEAGLAERDSIAEAAVQVVAAAGRQPAALFATVVSGGAPGWDLPNLSELGRFAAAEGLSMITVTDIRDDYLDYGLSVERISTARVPQNEVAIYRLANSDVIYLVIVDGDHKGAVGVQLHTGDASSLALQERHQARPCLPSADAAGLIHIQHIGSDSVNKSVDAAIVATIVADLGPASVRLVNDNSALERALRVRGIENSGRRNAASRELRNC